MTIAHYDVHITGADLKTTHDVTTTEHRAIPTAIERHFGKGATFRKLHHSRDGKLQYGQVWREGRKIAQVVQVHLRQRSAPSQPD